jgi:hypothetical protein
MTVSILIFSENYLVPFEVGSEVTLNTVPIKAKQAKWEDLAVLLPLSHNEL